ncbi:DNA integrity scanning diadenylate cyclase DisA [Actinotalea sp. BY-33]|uniref:diadenylate cyclase n=1 Tax=Actinotalea soli TaxID=2819234 RepID=A0A939LRY4_9CELL|nr:DNA integrity scanning diadenylate cyclase DisA [Actinotalea soli]MBO1753441.1 DNA integrity scanning diadenylate cyclase DisA [Actinotalea soli]
MVTTERSAEDKLRSTLAAVAPGTELRDGLERILRGRTGALIVLGHDDVVESMCSGGFTLDVDFSATRLRELAKMDGAIVVDRYATRVVRAAVQLLPDPTIETTESGTRHRTAERVAKQSGFPVVSVSQSMRIIALYVGGSRYVLEGSDIIQSRANQALATLERYKSRLDEVSGGIGSDRQLVIRDYVEANRAGRNLVDVQTDLAALDATELLDLAHIARVLGLVAIDDSLDGAVGPRGYRLLSKVPRLPSTIVDRLVGHFGGLQKLLAAGIDELMGVEGVGEQRARAVREGLSRLAESSILERYV